MTRHLTKRLGIAALVLLISGSASQPAVAQADAAIRRIPVEDWCRAEAARDMTAKLRLFTTDAVLMPPGESPVVGEQAIRTWHEAQWRQTNYQCSGTVDEAQILGDWAFVRGTYSGVLTPRSGAPTRLNGKFFNVLRRQADGSWRISRAIWN